MSTQRISDDQIIGAANQPTTRLPDPADVTSRISGEAGNIIGSRPMSLTQLNPGVVLILNGADFTILEHITSSGEAEIYLVQGQDSQVVLKYYFSNYKPKDEIITRLHALRRRDIMSPLDSGIYQDRFFEISEYMTGGTMDALAPLRDLALIKKYVGLIAEALKACHDNGIIHRDIKPVNIFFRTQTREEIVLGDFGISSALQAGSDYRFTTSVNRTTAYAAPELFTNINNQTTLDKKVDYYALGISFLELWLSADPFKDMAEFMAMRIKIEGRVAIPSAMDNALKDLIKGLITTEPPHRWGYEELQKWLAGEHVHVHETSIQQAFQPYEWDDLNNIVINDPKELASFMDADRKKATRQLYSRSIPDWVKNNSQDMYSELIFIVEKEFPNNTPENAEAGVTKAIYTLDRERSFKGFDGTICNSVGELARHIEANSGHYQASLKQPHADLYLFFETRGFDDRSKKYLKYFSEYNPAKALNLVVLDLDDNNLVVRKNVYDSVEALMKADIATTGELVKKIADPDSKISLWLAITYQNLTTSIARWRKNTAEQNEITLAYALNTSGYRINDNEVKDVLGFYSLLEHDPTLIVGDGSDEQHNAQLADHWLRNYQGSSLYAQLIILLGNADSLTAAQVMGIYRSMLRLPESDAINIAVAPSLLKYLPALSTAEKEQMADLTSHFFQDYLKKNADTMVFALDGLELILNDLEIVVATDQYYAETIATKLDDMIGKRIRQDLEKMRSNSDTFFNYYDRLAKFYARLRQFAAKVPSLADFERRKALIDNAQQQIATKYELEETGDKKQVEKAYDKLVKDTEKAKMNYGDIFKDYALIFWFTSSLITTYLAIVFDVIIFKSSSWLAGIFTAVSMVIFIGILTAVGYWVVKLFRMSGLIGKFLIRPVTNTPGSDLFRQLNTEKLRINKEMDSKLNLLDSRRNARTNNDLFLESIRILLAD